VSFHQHFTSSFESSLFESSFASSFLHKLFVQLFGVYIQFGFVIFWQKNIGCSQNDDEIDFRLIFTAQEVRSWQK